MTQNIQPGAGPLGIMEMTRQAAYLARCILNVPLESKSGDDLRQKHVDLKLAPEDLVCSIDDFAERVLMPAMYALVGALKRDGIKCMHALPMRCPQPPEISMARVEQGGLCLRGTLQRSTWSDDYGVVKPCFLLSFDAGYSI